jgi:SAM-dependent methyltransferase
VSSKEDQYTWQPRAGPSGRTQDVGAYLAHRAELIESLGRPLTTGDTVLDLACGDGGLGDALLARGLAYHGIDATSEMVESARRRLAGRANVELGDLNDYAPAEPVAATTVFRAIYYARDRAAFFQARRRVHREEARLRPSIRASTSWNEVLTDLRAAGFPRSR